MKKNLQKLFVLCLIPMSTLLSFSAFTQDVVLEKNGVILSVDEMLVAGSDLSQFERTEMRKNPILLKKFIEDLFDNKVMAHGIKPELLEDKKHLTLKKMSNNRFDNQYYIRKLALAKINGVDDFKTLAKQTYQSNIKKYQSPQTSDYYHVLFVKQHGSDAKAMATKLLNNIKEGKISLAEAAKKYQSIVAGVNEQGILEKVDDKTLMENIRKAVSQMVVGDMSDIIETDVGYHIIGLKKINKPEPIPYNEEIEADIIADTKKQIYLNVESEIRNKFKGPEGLTVDEKLLKSTSDAILKK